MDTYPRQYNNGLSVHNENDLYARVRLLEQGVYTGPERQLLLDWIRVQHGYPTKLRVKYHLGDLGLDLYREGYIQHLKGILYMLTRWPDGHVYQVAKAKRLHPNTRFSSW